MLGSGLTRGHMAPTPCAPTHACPRIPTPALACSPPTVAAPGAAASGLTPTSAVVAVSKPGTGTWAAFELAVCPTDTTKPCLATVVCEADSTPDDGTLCPVSTGLVQGETYSVKATACEEATCAAGSTKSEQATAAQTFTVPYA